MYVQKEADFFFKHTNCLLMKLETSESRLVFSLRLNVVGLSNELKTVMLQV